MKQLYPILLLVLLCTTKAMAQLNYPAPNQNFNTWVIQTGYYLDSMRVVINNDSLFDNEGGEYAAFKRYYNTNAPLLSGHGSFATYNQQINNYYLAHPLNNGLNNRAPQANNDAWEELGPKKPMPLSTNTKSMLVKANCPESGFSSNIGPTECIAISEINTQNMLVASISGGLFASADGGEHWANAGSDKQWQRIGCQYAQFNPTNANYWFACSPGYLTNTGAFYRTANAGGVWEKIGDQTNLGYWNTLYNFRISPNNANVIYLATADGLYKTTSATTPTASAVTWAKLTIPLPNAVATYMTNNNIAYDTTYKCYDVEFVGTQPTTAINTLVASITFNGNQTITATNDTTIIPVSITAYMHSTDGGTTWNILPNHPALNHWDKWYTIETSKAFPNYIFTLNSNQLQRFDFTTNTWKYIEEINVFMGGGHGFGVDNINGNIHVSEYIYYNKLEYDTLIDSYTKVYNNIILPATNSKRTTHDDNEDFVCSPTVANVVWCANHGGLAKSIDGGITWLDKSDGLGVAEMQQAAYSNGDGTSMLAGLYHDGHALSTTPYVPTSWNPDWKSVDYGDGNSAIIDNKNSNYMYTNSNIRTTATKDKYVGITQITDFGTPPWDNTMVLDKANTTTLFRANTWWIGSLKRSDQQIIRNFSRGRSGPNFNQRISSFWTKLLPQHPKLANYHIWRIYTPEAETYQKHLIAHIKCLDSTGVEYHRLFRTKIFNDIADSIIASWEELPLPSQNWCGQIIFDPTNPNILYIPYGSHNQNPNSITGTNMLFKVDYTNPSLLTYNFANDPNNTVNPALYLNLTRNLPNVSGGAFTIDKYSNGGMYFGTEVGVFYTNTKMLANNTNWVEFGAGLPNSGTKGLDINYATNKLRTPVWGRGMWQHDLYCPTDANLTETGIYSNSDYLEAQNTINSNAIVPNATQITYRAGTEVELTDGFAAVEGAEFGAFIHSCNTPYTNSFRKAKPTQQYSTPEVYNPTNPTTLNIHPNPTNGIVYITGTDSNLHYTLKNLTSSTLKQGRITHNQLSIAEYPAGMYLLQLTNANTGVSTTFKVVKE